MYLPPRFENREEAGRELAKVLRQKNFKNPVVIALPRGGVPVAAEVASELGAPLDLLIVRKIGLPYNPEFGIGAIAEGGQVWLDDYTLARVSVTPADLQSVIDAEWKELERRVKKYRRGRELIDVKGKTAILVDDGLATGVSARVAARALYRLGASEVVIAVPVCAPDSADRLRGEVSEVICVGEPEDFRSVGRFYDDFPQLTDSEVLELMLRSGKTGRRYTSSGSASSENRSPR